MPDDPLKTALDEMRAADATPALAMLSEAARAARKGYAPEFEEAEVDAADIAVTALDLARMSLLAAVEKALSFHERVPLYGNASTEGEPGNCPHHPDSDLHFEDGDGSGEWLCEGKPEGAVCSSCVDGEGGERIDWPCPEYESILAALTEKADGDV